MTKLMDLPIQLQQRRLFGLWDDFEWYVSAQRWTSVIASTGTVAAGSSTYSGGLILTNAASGNDEDYVKSTSSVFLFGQDQPIIAECRLQFTEANTNQASIIFGLMNGVATGALQNSGLPKTNFSGAVIFKQLGTTSWQTCSSLGTTQTITKANTQDINGNASDGNTHTLRIEVQPLSTTLAEVRYFIDGLQLRPATTPTAVMGIVDQLTFTGAAAMQLFVGIKNGSASAEVLTVDYLGGWQERYASGISH